MKIGVFSVPFAALPFEQMLKKVTGFGLDCYVMSIEHEDPLASVDEGLRHAVETLRAATLREPATTMWWA